MNNFAGVISFANKIAESAFPMLVPRALTLSGCTQIQTQTDTYATFASGVFSVAQLRSTATLRGDSNHFLAFDGRLDNGHELAARLQLPGSATDIEVLDAAITRWGDGTPSHLLGEFAYVHWEAARRRARLVNDIVGQKSLYYRYGDGMLQFSDALPALLAFNDGPPQLNEHGLADLLYDGILPDNNTIWAGVFQLLPASQVIVDADGVHCETYWRFDPERRIVFSRDEVYVEAARELLEQAVSCRLPASGKVAVTLSGGLDSPAIATTAAKLLAPSRLTSLTAVPAPGVTLLGDQDSYADERAYVEAIAAMTPNLDAECHAAPLDDPGTILGRAFSAGALPQRNTSNIEWLAPIHQRAKALGIEVLLNGGMGNLTLSYDGMARLPSLLRSGQAWTLLEELRATAQYLGMSTPRLAARVLVKSRLPASVYSHLQRLRGRYEGRPLAASGINAEFAAQTGVVKRRLENGLQALAQRPSDSRRLRIWGIQQNLRLRYLRGVNTRSTGLNTSSPLVDRRLMEFCLAIPDDQYLRNGQTRWLARRVLADRVPAAVLNNTRRGRQCPELLFRMQAQQAHLNAQLEQLESSLLAQRCLDLPRMRSVLNRLADIPNTRSDVPLLLMLHRTLHQGQFLRWVESGGQNSDHRAVY
jgi:asparagine synthase (glutamine-hydrolysing)